MNDDSKLIVPLLTLLCLMATAAPANALECANVGAAWNTQPEDTDDATATACGDTALAAGPASTALGYSASSVGDYSTAVGGNTSATGEGSTALGSSAIAIGFYSTAIGTSAGANGDWAIAIGNGTVANGSSSLALGDAAIAEGHQSDALGYLAWSIGDKSTALGHRAYADQPNTIVLGSIPGINERYPQGPNEYADVAIGTTTPLAPLHIFRDDATQEFLFLESNEPDTTQDRAMMYLVNNGGIRFEFNNPVLATAWRFQAATGNQDNFEITKVGTGQIEFKVDADGNAYLAGLLFESSDRNAKTNIHPVNPDAILEKVTQMPISQWAYKEAPDSHHIGPMAQDFRAAFGTGQNDTTLATMDVGGVAIASIQALEARNRELETRISKLESIEQENADLNERLAIVEALVTTLLPKTAQN